MAKDRVAPRQRFVHALLSPLTVVLGSAEMLQAQAKDWPAVAREALEMILTQGQRLQQTLSDLAASAEVEGDVVRVRWSDPRARPPTGVAQPTLAASPAAPPEAAREPASLPKGPRQILVVDDDAVTRSTLQQILQENGYEVALAASGTEAIDLARDHSPDLILLDVLMPDVSGWQMYTVFREDPLLTDVPIVIASSPADEQGLDGVAFPWTVPKPIRPEELLSTVEAALCAPRRRGPPSILIIDDEEEIRAEIGRTLAQRGYAVREAASGQEGLIEIARHCPDMVLLDLVLPDLDGMAVLRRLREDSATLTLPIVLLSVLDEPAVKAQGLRLGADDYISKPFSMLELEARIEAALRRKELEFSLSPSTRLPGNIAIERVLRRRVAAKVPFAVCYADLDNFKAYNDVYGFLKGDGVIHQTARALVEAVREMGNPDDFVGHIGGDDFLVVTTPERAKAICQRAVEEFERVIPLYYDAEARARGYIVALDRQGQPACFPLVTITLVIVSNEGRTIEHPGQLVDLIAELKQQAKRIPGSSIVSLGAD